MRQLEQKIKSRHAYAGFNCFRLNASFALKNRSSARHFVARIILFPIFVPDLKYAWMDTPLRTKTTLPVCRLSTDGLAGWPPPISKEMLRGGGTPESR
jgi:hypothetical protein